jgi:hypothetical protein
MSHRTQSCCVFSHTKIEPDTNSKFCIKQKPDNPQQQHCSSINWFSCKPVQSVSLSTPENVQIMQNNKLF